MQYTKSGAHNDDNYWMVILIATLITLKTVYDTVILMRGRGCCCLGFILTISGLASLIPSDSNLDHGRKS